MSAVSDLPLPHNLIEPALDHLPPDVFLRLSAAVDHMPAFPKSVEQILTLTRNVACSAKDLVQVINRDPVITVKVLRVVNSAYYGLAKQITSVDHAVVFLGFNTIKNLALSLAAVGMLPNKTLSGFDGQRYLMHSMATATLARQLAKRLPGADANDCFIAGLLHDFGKVVVAQFMPTEFRKAMELSLWRNLPLHQAMHEVMGVDHAHVGAMLAEKWHFAEDLVQTIRFQHTPSQSDTPMMASVVAANQLSKLMGYEFGGWLVIEELPESVAQRLGGKLESVKASLGDLGPLLNEAHVFSHL